VRGRKMGCIHSRFLNEVKGEKAAETLSPLSAFLSGRVDLSIGERSAAGTKRPLSPPHFCCSHGNPRPCMFTSVSRPLLLLRCCIVSLCFGESHSIPSLPTPGPHISLFTFRRSLLSFTANCYYRNSTQDRKIYVTRI